MIKIRVVIADDHSVLRSGLKLLLETQADMELIGEARSRLLGHSKELCSRTRIFGDWMLVSRRCNPVSVVFVGLLCLTAQSLLFECSKDFHFHRKFDVGADGETVG